VAEWVRGFAQSSSGWRSAGSPPEKVTIPYEVINFAMKIVTAAAGETFTASESPGGPAPLTSFGPKPMALSTTGFRRHIRRAEEQSGDGYTPTRGTSSAGKGQKASSSPLDRLMVKAGHLQVPSTVAQRAGFAGGAVERKVLPASRTQSNASDEAMEVEAKPKPEDAGRDSGRARAARADETRRLAELPPATMASTALAGRARKGDLPLSARSPRLADSDEGEESPTPVVQLSIGRPSKSQSKQAVLFPARERALGQSLTDDERHGEDDESSSEPMPLKRVGKVQHATAHGYVPFAVDGPDLIFAEVTGQSALDPRVDRIKREILRSPRTGSVVDNISSKFGFGVPGTLRRGRPRRGKRGERKIHVDLPSPPPEDRKSVAHLTSHASSNPSLLDAAPPAGGVQLNPLGLAQDRWSISSTRPRPGARVMRSTIGGNFRLPVADKAAHRRLSPAVAGPAKPRIGDSQPTDCSTCNTMVGTLPLLANGLLRERERSPVTKHEPTHCVVGGVGNWSSAQPVAQSARAVDLRNRAEQLLASGFSAPADRPLTSR